VLAHFPRHLQIAGSVIMFDSLALIKMRILHAPFSRR
jgi:hypothetical protein